MAFERRLAKLEALRGIRPHGPVLVLCDMTGGADASIGASPRCAFASSANGPVRLESKPGESAPAFLARLRAALGGPVRVVYVDWCDASL